MSFKQRLNQLVESGYRPEDDAETRRKKAALTLVPLIIGPAAFLWGSIYFFLGHPLSGSIPMSYSIISAVTLYRYFRHKRTEFLEKSQMLLVLLLPFLLMWSLGGFFHGSTVMIWALFAPIAASIFMGKKNAFSWFMAYFLLLLISGLIQGQLETITPLPEAATIVFFILNLGGGSAGLYLMVSYTSNQERVAISALSQKQHALETQTEGLRLANEQLQEARTAAEQANRAKSEFLANMSHEIRTPMNAVLNLSQIALATELTPAQRNYIEKVNHAGRNLLGIINDILDFSKIEAGKLQLEAVSFSLKAVIDDVLAIVSPAAEAKGLVLISALQNGTHLHYIGDPLRLRQVLTNLLNNAIKFTETGNIQLNLRQQQHDEVMELEFEVCDTGIGISRENQAQLFEPFQQADSSTTRRFGGTGLGLTISQHLLGLMGSRLELQSREGEGSRFSFTLQLPMSKDIASALATGTTGDSDTSEQALLQQLAAFRGSRILLVEDNEINQMIATELLREVLGLELTLANNGAEAIEQLAAEKFALVLMDLQMPVMDGYEATRIIRSDDSYKDLPIIAMTAHALVEERERCLASGMNDHIAKPIIIEELYTTLLRWLKSRGGKPE